MDLSLLKDEPERVRAALAKKHVELDFDRLLKLDNERRSLLKTVEDMRARQNDFNKRITTLKEGEREKALSDMKVLAQELSKNTKLLEKVSANFHALWLQVPNIPAKEVPEGASDEENKEFKTWGEKRKFDFAIKGHEEIVKNLDIADIERAAKVAGAKFYYLKGKGVILEMALMRFALDELMKSGFIPLTPPDLVRPEMMYAAAHFPPEDDAYALERDNLYLAGTAEVGLAGYHANETLKEQDLPAKYCGYSACFRREAGSYGKKGSGLYRVHQFHKIEMFVFCTPEQSAQMHEDLLSVAEGLMQKLKLPYRVVLNCGGDLGLPQYKKYDIEAWLPSTDGWGETHSCSNDTDYQARRLGTKFISEKGKKEYVHTLNNTAIASPRILIPILENYQRNDGSVEIPEVLQPYTGFKEIK